MRFIFKPTKFLILVTICAATFFIALRVMAATSTIRGAAWWGNNKYLYFNCADDVIGDHLDVTHNLSGAGQYPPPNDKFHFYSAPCSALIHGVYLNSDNNFSGKAWNPIQGLVSFDADATPPQNGYGFNSHCEHACNLSNSCWACYAEAEQKVYGWARVVNTGEWIKLDTATTTPVQLQSWDINDNNILPGHNIQAGDFIGYATSSPGDLSFNCESEGGGSGNCPTRRYKVYIKDLAIGHASAPNWDYDSACNHAQALRAVLRWDKKSGQYPDPNTGEIINSQTAFEVIVNTVNSTSSPICWSNKQYASSTNQYIIPNSDGPGCNNINYGTNYYWWVRLYDENDQPTDWYQYNSNSASDTDGDPDSNPKTFTTFKHEFPSPYFSWDPFDITVGTTTVFTSNSRYYSVLQPFTSQPCTDANCYYLWKTTDNLAQIGAATNSTTTIIFFHSATTTVTLKVTDNEGYFCSSTTPIRINYGLPLWREVKSQ